MYLNTVNLRVNKNDKAENITVAPLKAKRVKGGHLDLNVTQNVVSQLSDRANTKEEKL